MIGRQAGHVQQQSFRLSRTAAAAADDGEDVAVEKAKGGGEHSAEVSDREQSKRNPDNSVEHCHDHSR